MAENEFLKQLKVRWAEMFEDQKHVRFDEILDRWSKRPYPMDGLHRHLTPLVEEVQDLRGGLDHFLAEKYPKEILKAEEVRLEQVAAHQQACEFQQNSRLLALPRELRDKIWSEVVSNNVIHISQNFVRSSKRRFHTRSMLDKQFVYHTCTAPNGMNSSACPAGQLDHKNCCTDGPSNHLSIKYVCKQISMELPVMTDHLILSENALQFSDFEIAEEFLFGLDEEDRASITHLRLALPASLVNSDAPKNYNGGIPDSWQAICNYFSNPWERKTLDMYPDPNDEPWIVKLPIYFYYSSCYYQHNADRLHDRWQVGRGSVSWDIGISDLKYKGCPRLDIAMALPPEETSTSDSDSNFEDEDEDEESVDYWERVDFNEPQYEWLQALLQFHNYRGLRFEFYDRGRGSGEVSDVKKRWIKKLQRHIRGPEIGPQVCAFFAGEPYENGQQEYAQFMTSEPWY